MERRQIQAYSDEELIKLLCEIKKKYTLLGENCSPFRDIPSPKIQSGSKDF